MAHLYRHLRIHQLFGANTDVGKTVFATALCRASIARSRRHPQAESTGHDEQRASVYYLKPVSTGPSNEADDRYVVVVFFVALGSLGWMADDRFAHCPAHNVLRSIAKSSHVARFTRPRLGCNVPHNDSSVSFTAEIETKCLYQLKDPVSPHLAVKMAESATGAGQALPVSALLFYDVELFVSIKAVVLRITLKRHSSSVSHSTSPMYRKELLILLQCS